MSSTECPLPPGIGVAPQAIAGRTMKAVQMYSPYGYRGKIGLIVPSTNTVIEPEFNRMVPKGVSVHSGRIMLLGQTTEASYVKMAEETSRAAAELGTAECDVIAWGCTSGSCLVPREQLEGVIVENAGVPAVSTMTAVFEAMQTFSAKTISLGTPYVRFVNETEVEVIERGGVKVAAWYGLELGETQEERRGIGRVPPESLFRFVRYIDRPESDLIFLSCTNLATIDMLDALEQQVGKPVISSNQCTFWASIRRLGINDRIEGFGSLLIR